MGKAAESARIENKRETVPHTVTLHNGQSLHCSQAYIGATFSFVSTLLSNS